MTEDRVKSFQFRQEFARMVAGAMRRPVIVTNHNEPTVVLVSYEEYQQVKQFMYRINNGPPA